MMGAKQHFRIGGMDLSVTNLEKELYPSGFSKAEVIDYYARVAWVLLPHLKGRPITLKRYPDGADGEFFYERKCPAHRPRWLKTVSVPKKEGGCTDYCVVDSLAGLVWVANLASLELHTFLHKARSLKRPDAVAFDLDPGAPADIIDCCEVGLRLRELLEGMGLSGFPKTSGSKGLQVYVPLHTPTNYDATKEFARRMALQLEAEDPRRVVSKMTRDLRRGKVFVDWSQNDDHKTTVCAYSLRARETPTVSTPVTWKEVEACLKKGDASRLQFAPEEVLARVEKHGDLFEEVLTQKQKLPATKLLAALPAA